MKETMPSDYLECLWIMWDNNVITEQQVSDAVKLYGYGLTTVNSDMISVSNDTSTLTYTSKYAQEV